MRNTEQGEMGQDMERKNNMGIKTRNLKQQST